MPQSTAQLKAWLAARPQVQVVEESGARRPVSMPTRPLPASDAEEALLSEVRTLATQYGWVGEHSVHPQDGIRCTLVRGTDVLVVQLLRRGQKLTMVQQTWLHVLAHTGKIETYTWRSGHAADRAAMQARLSRRDARDATDET